MPQYRVATQAAQRRISKVDKPKRPIRIEGDIAFIPLTKGYEAIIDAADVPLVEGWNWTYANVGYAYRNPGILLHRMLLGLEVGDGRMGDHINGNKLDCRRANLRAATMGQNVQNRGARSDSRTGIKGVHFDHQKGLWAAEVKAGGVRVLRKRFKTKEEAAEAVRVARTLHHGEFARHE
jgi:HNH endonuclease